MNSLIPVIKPYVQDSWHQSDQYVQADQRAQRIQIRSLTPADAN